MLGRRSFWSERENDVRSTLSNEIHDLANQPILIDLAQPAIRMPGCSQRLDAEYLGGRGELAAPQRSQFCSRRDGDAGALSGIPVGGAKQIDSNPCCRELREGPSGRERFVVGMGKDARQPIHGSRR
jgi:hypothetical protein